MKPSEEQVSNLPQNDHSEYRLGLREKRVLQDTSHD